MIVCSVFCVGNGGGVEGIDQTDFPEWNANNMMMHLIVNVFVEVLV